MRSILYVLVALAFLATACATPFPTSYFYECGTVNCASFVHHDYSVLPQVLPLGGNPTLDLQWSQNITIAGNHAGQAIGCGFYYTGCGSVYGEGGVASLVSLGPDTPRLYGDINEAGFWAFGFPSTEGGVPPQLWGNGSSLGGTIGDVLTTQGIRLSVLEIYAINELGDVYVNALEGTPSAPTFRHGVLANTPIPEPSTFALSITGLVLATGRYLLRRRSRI